MTNLLKIAAPLLVTVTLLSTPASAATTINYTFNTTGSMADNGTYGNNILFQTTTGSSTLKLKVTGWQSKQSTNDITTAYVGAYSGGLGVTGINDTNGANGYHQIDNAFSYTDFILLQFDRAVTLSGANLNVYQMTNVSGMDSDLAYYNAGSIVTPAWDSAVNLTAYDTVPSTWTGADGGSASGFRALSPSAASTKWLVGAAFLPTTDRDDGFKISSLSVSELVPTVPEPATWAMMLIGFAAIGVGMRRAVRKSEDNFTTRVRAIAAGGAI